MEGVSRAEKGKSVNLKKTKRTGKEHNTGDGKMSKGMISKYHETGRRLEKRDQ